MKAVYLEKIGGSESLMLGKIPQLQPKAGEALVKINATASTPMEFQWFSTFHAPVGDARKPQGRRNVPSKRSRCGASAQVAIGAGIQTFGWKADRFD